MGSWFSLGRVPSLISAWVMKFWIWVYIYWRSICLVWPKYTRVQFWKDPSLIVKVFQHSCTFVHKAEINSNCLISNNSRILQFYSFKIGKYVCTKVVPKSFQGWSIKVIIFISFMNIVCQTDAIAAQASGVPKDVVYNN